MSGDAPSPCGLIPGFGVSRSSVGFVFKGDIAPPDYGLMSVANVGLLKLSFFERLPYPFVALALRYLREPHTDLSSVEAKFRPVVSPAGTIVDFSCTPDSRRYASLIRCMVKAGLLSVCSKEAPPFVVLPLFAVVKDVSMKLARPIENGRPLNCVATLPFSLLGTSGIVKALLARRWCKVSAIDADFSNYYFQVPNPRPLEHGVRVGEEFFAWKVLTMGWVRSCFIAQSLSFGFVLQCSPHSIPHDVIVMSSPPASVSVASALVVIVYDTILILDEDRFVDHWTAKLLHFGGAARLHFKYLNTRRAPSHFDWCGLTLAITLNGIQWMVASSALDPWLQFLSMGHVPTTARSLWRLLGFLEFAYSAVVRPTRVLGIARAAQASFANNVPWDVVDPTLSSILRDLCELIIAFPRLNAFVHRGCWKIPSNVAVFAFDATPKKWCVTRVLDTSFLDVLTGSFCPDVYIDVGEATGCERLLRAFGSMFSLLVIIGDNIPVLRAFFRGFSRSREIHRLVCSSGIHKLDSTLLFVDIESDGNVADIGSRPDESFSREEVAYRLARTLLRANEALREWRQTGNTYFARFAASDIPIPVEPE